MMLERWPTLLPCPNHTGTIRKQPEDFAVEEIPAYQPSGQGEHFMIEVEKRNMTTEELTRTIARYLKINPREIGYAGLKDRRAVTRQWLSIPASFKQPLSTFKTQGVCVLQSGLHGNKLKTGHLKGNCFHIRVRDLTPQAIQDILGRCDQLVSRGVPNYFGPQRFGDNFKNESEGLALLRGQGRRHDRRSLRFFLSAAQSGIFNDLLAQRIRQGLFLTVIPGDLLTRSDSGGIFKCTDPEIDQARMDALEVHPTGPIFGRKMKRPDGSAARMEQEVLERSGLDKKAFQKFPKLTQGTRRSLRMVPQGLEKSAQQDSLLLRFTLPPGAYATSILRELIRF